MSFSQCKSAKAAITELKEEPIGHPNICLKNLHKKWKDGS